MATTPAKTLAQFLAKRAAQDAAMPPEEAMHEAAESPEHEAAESPEHEAAEHMLGHGEGGGHEDVDHLLSQLSPEELEHLTSMLAEDMHPHGAEHGDMEGVPHEGMEGAEHGDMEGVPHEGMEGAEHEEADPQALAQAIQAHLAENPEANPEVSPEKMAALDFVKSAAYIEGFLEQAIGRGASVKEAVDLYDSALSRSIEALDVEKTAARKGRMASLRKTIRSGQSRPPQQKRKPLNPEGLDASKLHADAPKVDAPKEKSNLGRNIALGLGAAGVVGGGAYALSKKEKEEEKTAAYYEGFLERAREYGISDHETLQIVKSANAPSVPKNVERSFLNQVKRQLHRNRGSVGTAGGLLAGYGLNSYLSDDK